ncbi:putative biosynthetic protein, family [Hartmannibacter diazotrophicus]|uniref:Putative biosynthetic protein, family n=1 Tax=Hartmannibacter diazotrophicus TaxID=1482074 RepID=A0A2C9DAE4_9HYPH|nr:Pnap_2097 family protein [Hartmannibacter diazotrophicus]SON57108.1 putative biosynthetic protein, family [Hartmannibacter diazotrophicus]
MTVNFSQAEQDGLRDLHGDGQPFTIRLGMPHLCLGGLSENWLLKELGHRHWTMLARACGRMHPDFRTPDGEPVYAAFNAVRLEDCDFGSLGENDLLTISSDLARISRTQVLTRHALTSAGRLVGSIELISVFVCRQEKGRNRSVARLEVDGLPAIDRETIGWSVAAEAPGLRAGRWEQHFGLSRSAADEEGKPSLLIDPVPTVDFNGANFLYFASFQAFVDRAEWAFFRNDPLVAATVRRDIVYCGNIEPGERVIASLMASERQGGRLTHWCRLTRAEGGERLADVFTERRTLAGPAD